MADVPVALILIVGSVLAVLAGIGIMLWTTEG